MEQLHFPFVEPREYFTVEAVGYIPKHETFKETLAVADIDFNGILEDMLLAPSNDDLELEKTKLILTIERVKF